MLTPPTQPYDELRPPLDPGVNWRKSAVLLLLYPLGGEDYIVFTRRTDTVEHHKGQISFPGGSQDPTDRDAVDTALREAQEEMGIAPAAVEVLGTLPDVYARVSSFVITPVVGRFKTEVAERGGIIFRPNPDEVAEIIEVPLQHLRDDSIHRIEQRTHQGITYNVHFYTYGPYEIWGATGRILAEFLSTDEYRALGS